MYMCCGYRVCDFVRNKDLLYVTTLRVHPLRTHYETFDLLVALFYVTMLIYCMFLSPVDENEVIRVVESCKNKSSADAEGLSMNIVKHIITTIIKPLTHIFNTSFKTGVFQINKKLLK